MKVYVVSFLTDDGNALLPSMAFVSVGYAIEHALSLAEEGATWQEVPLPEGERRMWTIGNLFAEIAVSEVELE